MEENRTVKEIIEQLEKKYAGDEDAMEVINDTKEDIGYIRKKEEEGGYDGQPAIGKALELEGHLETWYPIINK